MAPSDPARNNNVVVYPRLWTALWSNAALRALLGVAVVVFLAWLTATYGALRSLIAVAIFAAILLFGLRSLRSLLTVPPEPEPTDVSDYDLRYVCTMCGLELKLEVAARDKPPSHCGEKMVLKTRRGKPPLRPV